MGNGRRKRQEFLGQHPLCCFCGGNTASVERDHVPGRAFFADRHWPEGFEFPACEQCNRATRNIEQVAALLSFINTDVPPGIDEIFKRVHAAENNNPGLLEEMKPTLQQLKTAREKYGLMPPAGEDITAMRVRFVSGPIVSNAMAQFSRKLLCALFYKHTNQILRSAGVIATRWYTNVQINAEEIDRALAKVTPNVPVLERNTMVLNDQFFYRYGIVDTKRVGAFLAFFRQSFAILGVVNQDANELNIKDGVAVMHPYDWSVPKAGEPT